MQTCEHPETVKPAKKRRTVRIFLLLLFFGIYIALSPLVAMRLYRYILFYPWKFPSGYYENSAVNNMLPKDVWFHARSGAKLHGWYYDLKDANFVVIVHHGQGANLTVLRPWVKIFLDCKCSVLVYDYEGFGKSEGEPSIDALRDDGLAAFDYVCNGEHVPSARIVNLGESLGTGVAAFVTEKRQAAGLILISPYASLAECAQQLYPVLYVYPRFLFPGQELECRSCMTRAHPPVLIVHGTRDPVISISNADELFSIARDPKKYIRLEGSGHCPLDRNHQSVLRGFLNSASYARNLD